MHLDRHPSWKILATQEAEEILGSKDNVDYADLSKLSTISNCLKESLRLSPPASIIGVEPSEDFTIPHHVKQSTYSCDDTSATGPHSRHAGQIIPSGARTLISTYAMHRHPLLWSNADKFLPDRWMAKTKETTTPFAFTPFSMGSRSCIGQVGTDYPIQDMIWPDKTIDCA